MNLLGQEITPAAIIKHIVEVQKYFCNHHRPAAWLKQQPNTVKPQLPNDTRWNSQLTCIDTFLKNRSAYLKICEENEEAIDARISQLVNNYNLYKQVKDLHAQLQSVGKCLDKLQGDSATLADACHEWLGLMKDKNLMQYKNQIAARMKAALQPFHFLAYMTDPKYKGERLNDQQKEQARNWLHAKLPDRLSSLIAFEAETEPYPASFFKVKDLKASVWWKGLTKSKKLPTDFVRLMIQLQCAPPSSASIERIFSNFGLVHSKLLNRLGVEKATKLVFCYRMLRGGLDIDWV